MATPETSLEATPARRTAVAALAAVGFFSLVAGGMWLAVYSARYVPNALASIGAAAVSLGSIFIPASLPGLSVVPAASTTLPFAPAAPEPATSTPARNPAAPVAPSAGNETSSVTQISGATATPVLSGLADLATTIEASGYLSSASTTAFVATSTVPAGARPAVKFVIKNVGTNATGSWNFSAKIPTASGYLYISPAQQSLNPGESIEYTLGFDQALRGSNQTITITANASNAVKESSQTNNVASATLTVLGS